MAAERDRELLLRFVLEQHSARLALPPGGSTLDAVRLAAVPVPALLAALRAYFVRRGIEASWDVISRMPDGELITTLGMVCPFGAPEKQALLEAATPTDQAATLLALLQMDIHAPGDNASSGRAS